MNAAARALAAVGALCCALAVAVSAWASHGLAGEDATRAGLAAAFAFGHGLALLVLAPGARPPRLLGLAALLAGLLLFSGSLLGAVLAGLPTALAPVGGWLLMAGWLVVGADALRR